MRIALVATPFNDINLQLAAQVGVDFIVARYPEHYGLTLSQLCDRAAAYGLRVGVVEGYIPMSAIIYGRPKRDLEIEGFQQLLANMANHDVRVCCYNFMPYNDWTRTSIDASERGGARVTAFDLAKLDAPQSESPMTTEALWDNLAYFLEQIVPTAASLGVKLAMHPDDPPIPKLAGHDQILGSPQAFDRFLALHDDAHHGMCFCQGTFAEMGDLDIPELIRHFGSRINYVHLRDVVGAVPAFVESFHDNGKTDMAAAIHAYQQIGYDGLARPDHVPTLAGESNSEPGYHMAGRLFAVGYMRGLLHATNR